MNFRLTVYFVRAKKAKGVLAIIHRGRQIHLFIKTDILWQGTNSKASKVYC